MARTATGDRVAAAELYRRHAARVHRVARRHLGDDAAARDALQDVFVRLLRGAGRYRPEGRFDAWLTRVTVNVCLNERARAWRRLRDRWSSGGPPDDTAGTWESRLPDPDGVDPEAALARSELRAAVRAAVDRLPPRQRMAVVLRRFEGLDHAAIGHALDCSPNAVARLLVRARRRLAADLG